jgi:hypothetical protein
MAPTALRAVPDFDYDAALAAAAQAWLEQLDDLWLACRYNHAFPKIHARNGKLPRGVSARPLAGRTGSFQMRQTCRDCGIVRVFTCTGDIFGSGRNYSYEWPEGYQMPKGASAYVDIAAINAERNRRAREGLRQVPGLAELLAEAEAAQRDAEQVAAARAAVAKQDAAAKPRKARKGK